MPAEWSEPDALLVGETNETPSSHSVTLLSLMLMEQNLIGSDNGALLNLWCLIPRQSMKALIRHLYSKLLNGLPCHLVRRMQSLSIMHYWPLWLHRRKLLPSYGVRIMEVVAEYKNLVKRSVNALSYVFIIKYEYSQICTVKANVAYHSFSLPKFRLNDLPSNLSRPLHPHPRGYDSTRTCDRQFIRQSHAVDKYTDITHLQYISIWPMQVRPSHIKSNCL